MELPQYFLTFPTSSCKKKLGFRSIWSHIEVLDGSGIVCGTVGGVVANRPATWSLGHVRLAILDLTEAGAQPMKSRDGLVWISYNGEVYNFIELAVELQSLGHQFETRSDTEVLLAAYREWGSQSVNRFRGMFALVIVDLAQSVVFVARDRLGIKPLYFWAGKDQTHLVSEPKQLLSVAEFQPRLQAQQCVDYLTEGLLGHDPSLTMFDQVHALPAGQCLTWSLGERPQLGKCDFLLATESIGGCHFLARRSSTDR